ncbi:MAG: SDR family NAD(P)-dependent oxidoreductase [Thermonemataceae bacterium]|nr:SDR family NAD(P)-dependent oxidoreductase [Thermonemataceae bacterium]
MEKFALITGGSQGLGKAIAEELAHRKINLLLVALDSPELYETAAYLQDTYPIKVKIFAINLAETQAAEQIFEFVQKENISIQYLINNVGLGYTGAFESLNLSFFDTILQLNITILTKLTYLFLPQLKKNTPAYILNVSSMAGLFTIPFKTVYSASKNYVYVFSRALREELRGTGVSVTVLNPGGMLTNARIIEDTEKMGKMAKIITATPQEVALQAVRAMFAKKAVCVPKLLVRLYAFSRYLIPYSLQLKIIAKGLKKNYLQKIEENIPS